MQVHFFAKTVQAKLRKIFSNSYFRLCSRSVGIHRTNVINTVLIGYFSKDFEKSFQFSICFFYIFVIYKN